MTPLLNQHLRCHLQPELAAHICPFLRKTLINNNIFYIRVGRHYRWFDIPDVIPVFAAIPVFFLIYSVNNTRRSVEELFLINLALITVLGYCEFFYQVNQLS